MIAQNLCFRVLFFLSFLSTPVFIMAQSALDIFNQGIEIEQKGDFAKAQSLYTQAYEAFVNEGLGECADASQCLHNLARAYANLGKMEESRKYIHKALELREKCFGKVSEQYVSSLNNLAITYRQSDMAKALEIQKEVIALMEQLPKTCSQAAMFYRNLGLYYYMEDEIANAAEYFEKSLSNEVKFSEDYQWLLNALYDIYTSLDRYEDTHRIMSLSEEHLNYELEKECEDPECMLQRAQHYQGKGDNEKAQEYYNALRSMQLDDRMTAKVYEQYGGYVSQTNPEVAAESYNTAANALLRYSGESDDYGRLLYMSGLCYFMAKNYDLAIEQLNKALELYSSLPGDNVKKVIDCKRFLATDYDVRGTINKNEEDHQMAIKYGQDVLDYFSAKYRGGKDHADALERLASYEKFAGSYQSSIDHYKQAIEMYQSLGDAIGAQDASSGLTFCYSAAGIVDQEAPTDHNSYYKAQIEKVDEIIATEIGDLDIVRDYLGKIVYATSLGSIAGGYCMKGDYLTALGDEQTNADYPDNSDPVVYVAQARDNYTKSVEYYSIYLPQLREAIQEEFRLRNPRERMEIWNDCKNDINQIGVFLVTLPVGNEDLMPELSGILYDATLLSKGILLRSSIEFEEVLASADPHLKDIYEQTKRNEATLSSLRMSEGGEEVLKEIKELQAVNDALQLELMRGCSEYADFTNYISYSWKDVQNKLKDDDVAIEFVTIEPNAWDEDNFLAALVLTKDMEQPEAIPICDIRTAKYMEIFAAQDNADSLIYSNPAAGYQVWGNLRQYLTGKKKIFFSADGPFNRVALEYLPWNGRPLSEQFDVYRLSTTKELCYERKSKPIKNMVLLGNIAYNDEGVMDRKTKRSLEKLRQIGGDFMFVDLEQSKREIDDIESLMKKNSDRKVVKLEGVKANEEALKQLSGSNINLLHIATHGAYIDKKNQTDEEAMQNSILALAGANIGGDQDNDGLVTAADIAKMNLRNCDLVVLSACETGLGKLSDDGVFGLQRGFKNAGVHQLMMSLKSVYDKATADMMIVFYRNLANGFSARESLIEAQKELRAKGYTDAKYWAPFIILDAID